MSLDTLQPILHWLQLHPWLAIVFAFFISFIESIALVGIFIPGAVILTAIGILIGAQIIPGISTMSAAILGAFFGDVVSFSYGRLYHEKVRQFSFFHRHSSWLNAAELFFHKHGGKGIFIARFIGPLRPIMPMIAGMFNMPWLRFCLVDVFSAMFWAPAYMLPGIAVGAAAQTFNAKSATRLIIFILAILIAFWISFWLIKKIYFFILKNLHKFYQYQWTHHFIYYKWTHYFKIPNQTNNSQPLLYLSLIVINFLFFIFLAYFSFRHQEYSSLNINVWHFFRSFYSLSGQRISVLISLLFSPFNLFFLWFILSAYFCYQKSYRLLIVWISLGCFGIGLAGITKHLLNLPRPPGLIFPPTDAAFPSGHVTIATTLLLCLSYLLFQTQEKIIQQWAQRVCYCLILLLALSRLYLGVHWLTDVTAAFCLGLVLWFSAKLFFLRFPKYDISTKTLAFLTLCSLTVGFTIQLAKHFHIQMEDLTPAWPDTGLSADLWWQTGYTEKLLYRENRLGHPLQTLNIQWLSSLETIEKNLLIQGWKALPKSKILNAIDYLNDTNQPKSPLATGFFNDQKPILEMVKFDPNFHLLAVLRLWQSNIDIYQPNYKSQKLLVGLIFYHFEHNFHFKTHIPLSSTPPAGSLNPQQFLIQNLAPNFQSRLISIQAEPLNREDDISWQGKLLLIRNINN